MSTTDLRAALQRLHDEMTVFRDACGYCCAAGQPPNSQMTRNASIALSEAREALAAVPEPTYDVTRHDCEAELKARADYNIFRGTPDIFECSCGARWAYTDDESEGAWWEPIVEDEASEPPCVTALDESPALGALLALAERERAEGEAER